VAERAGRNLIDCSLELGGNNPLIVLDDTDVDEGGPRRGTGLLLERWAALSVGGANLCR